MIIGVELTADKIRKLCTALNHHLKLRIIDYIYKNNGKSITDIKNRFNVSFSTVHKYLDQLEKADILYSITSISAGGTK